jgi:CHAT domain-containing protein/tetratricopeptide (TPR) repeat protein
MPTRAHWLSLLALAVGAPVAASETCPDPLPVAGALLTRTLVVGGRNAAPRVELPVQGRPLLIKVVEKGIDVDFVVFDANQAVVARSASPVIRTGVALGHMAASTGRRTLVISTKEHSTHLGSVEVIVRTVSDAQACGKLARRLAEPDMRYAAAHATARSKREPGDTPAREIFLDSARKYRDLLADPGLTPGQSGSIQFALASLSYYDLSDWSASAEWAIRAAATFTLTANHYANARARAVLAAAWLETATSSSSGAVSTAAPQESQARFDAARKLLKELEAFHRRRGEAYDAALQTNNIGLAHYYQARIAEAIPLYTSAMKEFERLGEPQRVGLSLQNLALCDWGQGRMSAALPQFAKALTLIEADADPDLYLLTLNSSALAHYAAGKFDESLRLHTRALTYADEVQNDYYHGRSLMGLGITYYAIGDRRLAGQFLRSALDVLSASFDGRGRITTLRSLAIVEHDEKRYAEAVGYNLEALKSGVASSARARIKVRLAADYAALGDAQRAKAELESVINDPAGTNALVRAEGLLELGRILLTEGDHPGARRALTTALQGFQSMQSIAGEFDSRLEIARLERATRHDAEAMKALSEALGFADEIATQTGNPEYRASVVQSLRPAQELMVDLQYSRYARALGEGRHAEAQNIARAALEFADSTRAQSFGQILAQRFARDDPELAKLLSERAALHRDLADRRYYLSTREDRRGPDDAMAKELRVEIAGLRARLGIKNTELAARSGKAGTPFAGATLATLDFTRTPANRMYVEYWLGSPNAYAWVGTNKGVRWVRLGSTLEINRLARDLHESMRRVALTRRDNQSQRESRRLALAKLHGRLIAPLGPLQGTQELVVAADGALHVVPFAALRGVGAAERYLVADHAIAFVPALRFAAMNSPAPSGVRPDDRILLVDDPVYEQDDKRLAGMQPSPVITKKSDAPFASGSSAAPERHERLPLTAREAAAIQRLFGSGQVDQLEGLDAVKRSLLDRNLASYRYIHIASHGEMNLEVPTLSALILGKFGRGGPVGDQKVWVDDLLSQTFNAEVVALSACDTSLGPEFAGEGPIGLRYAVLARGARSVVSSLWPVAEEITADLMTEMYGELTSKAIRADSALTFAMRGLLAKRPTLDPALWAPYTVHLAYQQVRKQ